MPAKLLFDGYYYSGPTAWEDWHAGVRLHGIRFYYKRYYPNGDWIHCYRDAEFTFWDFTESVTPEMFAISKLDRAPRIGDYDPLCTAGTYTIADNILTEILAPDWTAGQTWEFQFEILDDRLVGRTAQITYLFAPGRPGLSSTTQLPA